MVVPATLMPRILPVVFTDDFFGGGQPEWIAWLQMLRTRSASENRNHAAACDSILQAGRREGAASPRRAAS